MKRTKRNTTGEAEIWLIMAVAMFIVSIAAYFMFDTRTLAALAQSTPQEQPAPAGTAPAATPTAKDEVPKGSTAEAAKPAAAGEGAKAGEAGAAPAPGAEGAKGDAAKKDNLQSGTINPEIIMDVEQRQKKLNEREEELNRRDDQLKTLQGDVEKQISEMKAVQAKIDESIKLRTDLEEKAVKKLAKTYSTMPPANAAKLLQQLDNAIAIRVLSAMKEKSAGAILAASPPAVATKLSEGLVKKK